MAIHVPFHIRNRARSEDVGNHFHHGVPHLLPAEVEDELVARFGTRAVRHVEAPVRMRAV